MTTEVTLDLEKIEKAAIKRGEAHPTSGGYSLVSAWIADKDDASGIRPYSPACDEGDLIVSMTGNARGSVSWEQNFGNPANYLA